MTAAIALWWGFPAMAKAAEDFCQINSLTARFGCL